MALLYLMYPWFGDFIAIVGLTQERELVGKIKKSFFGVEALNTWSINAPTYLPGVDFSDHRSYWKHDWPAVMITDTAFFRNFEYHKKGDTADRLNFSKMSLVVDALYRSVLELE